MRMTRSTPHCTLEDILEYVQHLKNSGMTDDQINKVPVYIERIHDVYFEEHNWNSVKRPTGIRGESEYILAWCPVLGTDAEGNPELRIDAHY